MKPVGSAQSLGPHLAPWSRDPGGDFWVHKCTRGHGWVLPGGALHKEDALGKPGVGEGGLEGSGAAPEAAGGRALPCSPRVRAPGFLSCCLNAAILINGNTDSKHRKMTFSRANILLKYNIGQRALRP